MLNDVSPLDHYFNIKLIWYVIIISMIKIYMSACHKIVKFNINIIYLMVNYIYDLHEL